MKTVVIIPSRYGSSRFEGKPLAPICGKPMIQHVFEAASRSAHVDMVAVATDDPRILDAVHAFGGHAIMTDEMQRSGTDRTAQAATILGLNDDDRIVNVQGDQPLLNPRCIAQVVQPLLADTGVRMTTLAYRIVDPLEYQNPKDVKVVTSQNGDALYFSRAPIPFGRDDTDVESYKHLGVYAYTKQFLDQFARLPSGRLEQIEKLEQLRALEFGYAIRVVTTEYDSPEVDLPEDIARIEALLTP